MDTTLTVEWRERDRGRGESREAMEQPALGVVAGCVWVVVTAGLWSCKEQKKDEVAPAPTQSGAPMQTPVARADKPPPEPDPTDGPNLDRELLVRVARQLLAAAPSGGDAGMAGKEIASARLGLVGELLDNSDEHMLWGAYDATKGVDPESYRLMELPPLVWARAYLSCFELTGKYTMREEGEFGVLEMGARFRAELPSGEYPHPLWHSGEEWYSYTGTGAIVLAFYHGKSFVAAYRKQTGEAGAPAPAWDRRWTWTDGGGEQPRGARVRGSLATTNPHSAGVEAAYRKLEPMLTARGCFKCHTPDNPAGATALVLLRYPAQAMAAKDALAAVLRENSMPPGNPAKGIAEGIADEAARQAMIGAADAWGKLVHEAMEFESAARKPVESPAATAKNVP